MQDRQKITGLAGFGGRQWSGVEQVKHGCRTASGPSQEISPKEGMRRQAGTGDKEQVWVRNRLNEEQGTGTDGNAGKVSEQEAGTKRQRGIKLEN